MCRGGSEFSQNYVCFQILVLEYRILVSESMIWINVNSLCTLKCFIDPEKYTECDLNVMLICLFKEVSYTYFALHLYSVLKLRLVYIFAWYNLLYLELWLLVLE